MKPSPRRPLEQAVDRRRLGAGELAEPARRLAGRRAQPHACAAARAARSTSARIVCVLPVPGPPVRIDSRCSSAWSTACHCSSVRTTRRRRPLDASPRSARLGVEQLAHAARQPPLDRRRSTRVDDAVVLVDEPPAAASVVDAVVDVGAEQPRARGTRARRAAGGSGRRPRPRAARGRCPASSRAGSSGGVPSARASASAVAKPMPSTSVAAYGSVCSCSIAPGPERAEDPRRGRRRARRAPRGTAAPRAARRCVLPRARPPRPSRRSPIPGTSPSAPRGSRSIASSTSRAVAVEQPRGARGPDVLDRVQVARARASSPVGLARRGRARRRTAARACGARASRPPTSTVSPAWTWASGPVSVTSSPSSVTPASTAKSSSSTLAHRHHLDRQLLHRPRDAYARRGSGRCDTVPRMADLGAHPHRDRHAVRRRPAASTRRRSSTSCATSATHGSDGVVVCGTTGEAPTLTDEEHLRLIELAVQERPRRHDGRRRHRLQRHAPRGPHDRARDRARRRRDPHRHAVLQQAQPRAG